MCILRYSASGSLVTLMVGPFTLEHSFRSCLAEISPSTWFCQALKIMACILQYLACWYRNTAPFDKNCICRLTFWDSFWSVSIGKYILRDCWKWAWVLLCLCHPSTLLFVLIGWPNTLHSDIWSYINLGSESSSVEVNHLVVNCLEIGNMPGCELSMAMKPPAPI